jgi:hypothetical protein
MSTTYPATIAIDLARKGTIARLERLAWFTDSAIHTPGTTRSFGADAVLSLVPGIGTLAGGGISLYVLAEAIRHGAPPATLTRMGGNIALDMTLGAIPVVGVLFDLMFKANQRNLNLLRNHLRETT